MEVILLGLGLLIVGLLIYLVLIYNSMVTLRNNRKQAFSDIDVQMKLRYDLVPNLVEVVKGYAKHEREIFEEIANVRARAMSAGSVNEKIEADNSFSATLKTLFAVAENYPELKANENFLKLQTELADIENKIAAARRFFNNSTKEYNSVLMQFPNVLIAKAFNFAEEPFFGLLEEKEQASKVVKVEV